MSLSSDDFLNAVATLNDLSRRGLIKWHRGQPVRLGASVGTAFEATHNGQHLRVVEYSPPRVAGFYQGLQSNARTQGVIASQDVVVEIVDEQGTPIYEFPRVPGIAELFDTIRYRSTDVEDFIKSLGTTR